jgi:methionyl-tRNA synthetase
LLAFTQSRFGGVVPEPGALAPADAAMLERARATFDAVAEHVEAVHLRDGLLAIMALAAELNRYLDEAAPWKSLKTDPARAATSLWTALQVISALRVLTAPYLPFSAQQLHDYLGDEGDVHELPWVFRELPAGRALPPPQPLFRKFDDDELADLVERLEAEPVVTGEPG